MRNHLCAAIAVVVTCLAAPSPALAGWLAAGADDVHPTADIVLTASTPTVTATGPTAIVSWLPSTLASGAPVSGHRVTRIDTVTGVVAAAAGSCAGTVTAPSCVEPALPSGRWAYRLVATRGTWTGPPSPWSDAVAIDATPPVVTAGVLQKALGGATGAVRESGTYRLYAAAVDAGDPASGVATVRADASALTSGATAVTMLPGTFAVGDVTYGYRSPQLTADMPLAAGERTFTVTATDLAGNVGVPAAFAVSIDNTGPAPADVDVTNGVGTVGRADAGDVAVLTFSEAVDPDSVLETWTGGPTAVTVRLANNGGGDRLQVRHAGSDAVMRLGTVFLGHPGYVNGIRDFAGSTMELVGTTIVITLGTPSGATGTVSEATSATWTSTSDLRDPAGNPSAAATVTESGPLDPQF